MDPTERLAAALSTERGRQRLTIAELADRAGLDPQSVEAIERGTANPHLTEIVAVARALDTTASALLA